MPKQQRVTITIVPPTNNVWVGLSRFFGSSAPLQRK